MEKLHISKQFSDEEIEAKNITVRNCHKSLNLKINPSDLAENYLNSSVLGCISFQKVSPSDILGKQVLFEPDKFVKLVSSSRKRSKKMPVDLGKKNFKNEQISNYENNDKYEFGCNKVEDPRIKIRKDIFPKASHATRQMVSFGLLDKIDTKKICNYDETLNSGSKTQIRAIKKFQDGKSQCLHNINLTNVGNSVGWNYNTENDSESSIVSIAYSDPPFKHEKRKHSDEYICCNSNSNFKKLCYMNIGADKHNISKHFKFDMLNDPNGCSEQPAIYHCQNFKTLKSESNNTNNSTDTSQTVLKKCKVILKDCEKLDSSKLDSSIKGVVKFHKKLGSFKLDTSIKGNIKLHRKLDNSNIANSNLKLHRKLDNSNSVKGDIKLHKNIASVVGNMTVIDDQNIKEEAYSANCEEDYLFRSDKCKVSSDKVGSNNICEEMASECEDEIKKKTISDHQNEAIEKFYTNSKKCTTGEENCTFANNMKIKVENLDQNGIHDSEKSNFCTTFKEISKPVYNTLSVINTENLKLPYADNNQNAQLDATKSCSIPRLSLYDPVKNKCGSKSDRSLENKMITDQNDDTLMVNNCEHNNLATMMTVRVALLRNPVLEKFISGVENSSYAQPFKNHQVTSTPNVEGTNQDAFTQSKLIPIQQVKAENEIENDLAIKMEPKFDISESQIEQLNLFPQNSAPEPCIRNAKIECKSPNLEEELKTIESYKKFEENLETFVGKDHSENLEKELESFISRECRKDLHFAKDSNFGELELFLFEDCSNSESNIKALEEYLRNDPELNIKNNQNIVLAEMEDTEPLFEGFENVPGENTKFKKIMNILNSFTKNGKAKSLYKSDCSKNKSQTKATPYNTRSKLRKSYSSKLVSVDDSKVRNWCFSMFDKYKGFNNDLASPFQHSKRRETSNLGKSTNNKYNRTIMKETFAPRNQGKGNSRNNENRLGKDFHCTNIFKRKAINSKKNSYFGKLTSRKFKIIQTELLENSVSNNVESAKPHSKFPTLIPLTKNVQLSPAKQASNLSSQNNKDSEMKISNYCISETHCRSINYSTKESSVKDSNKTCDEEEYVDVESVNDTNELPLYLKYQNESNKNYRGYEENCFEVHNDKKFNQFGDSKFPVHFDVQLPDDSELQVHSACSKINSISEECFDNEKSLDTGLQQNVVSVSDISFDSDKSKQFTVEETRSKIGEVDQNSKQEIIRKATGTKLEFTEAISKFVVKSGSDCRLISGQKHSQKHLKSMTNTEAISEFVVKSGNDCRLNNVQKHSQKYLRSMTNCGRTSFKNLSGTTELLLRFDSPESRMDLENSLKIKETNKETSQVCSKPTQDKPKISNLCNSFNGEATPFEYVSEVLSEVIKETVHIGQFNGKQSNDRLGSENIAGYEETGNLVRKNELRVPLKGRTENSENIKKNFFEGIAIPTLHSCNTLHDKIKHCSIYSKITAEETSPNDRKFRINTDASNTLTENNNNSNTVSCTVFEVNKPITIMLPDINPESLNRENDICKNMFNILPDASAQTKDVDVSFKNSEREVAKKMDETEKLSKISCEQKEGFLLKYANSYKQQELCQLSSGNADIKEHIKNYDSFMSSQEQICNIHSISIQRNSYRHVSCQSGNKNILHITQTSSRKKHSSYRNFLEKTHLSNDQKRFCKLGEISEYITRNQNLCSSDKQSQFITSCSDKSSEKDVKCNLENVNVLDIKEINEENTNSSYHIAQLPGKNGSPFDAATNFEQKTELSPKLNLIKDNHNTIPLVSNAELFDETSLLADDEYTQRSSNKPKCTTSAIREISADSNPNQREVRFLLNVYCRSEQFENSKPLQIKVKHQIPSETFNITVKNTELLSSAPEDIFENNKPKTELQKTPCIQENTSFSTENYQTLDNSCIITTSKDRKIIDRKNKKKVTDNDTGESFLKANAEYSEKEINSSRSLEVETTKRMNSEVISVTNYPVNGNGARNWTSGKEDVIGQRNYEDLDVCSFSIFSKAGSHKIDSLHNYFRPDIPSDAKKTDSSACASSGASSCKDVSTLNIPLRSHTGQEKYKCNRCSYSTSFSSIAYHIRRIHALCAKGSLSFLSPSRTNIFKENKLPKIFSSKFLNHKSLKQTDSTYFYCTLCSFRSYHCRIVKNHILMHSKTFEKCISCRFCSMKSVDLICMMYHLRSHNTGLILNASRTKFSCAICLRMFTQAKHCDHILVTHRKDFKISLNQNIGMARPYNREVTQMPILTDDDKVEVNFRDGQSRIQWHASQNICSIAKENIQCSGSFPLLQKVYSKYSDRDDIHQNCSADVGIWQLPDNNVDITNENSNSGFLKDSVIEVKKNNLGSNEYQSSCGTIYSSFSVNENCKNKLVTDNIKCYSSNIDTISESIRTLSDKKRINIKCTSMKKYTMNSREPQSVSSSESSEYFENAYKCRYCKYETDKLFQLNNHLIEHSSFNPFQCSFCPQTFSHRSYLKSHMKKHADEENNI